MSPFSRYCVVFALLTTCARSLSASDPVAVSWPRLGLASTSLSRPSIAQGPSGFVAVWQANGSLSSLRARFLDPSGKPVGDRAMVLPDVGRPHAVWLAGRYLVTGSQGAVWLSERGEVQPGTAVVDGEPIAVASNGVSAAILYQIRVSGGGQSWGQVRVAIVDSQAQTLADYFVVSTYSCCFEGIGAITSSGSGFVSAVSAYGGITTNYADASRIAPSGYIGQGQQVAVASIGSEALVAWMSAANELTARRVDDHGRPLGQSVRASATGSTVAATSKGGRYAIVVSSPEEVTAFTFDPAGTALSEAGSVTRDLVWYDRAAAVAANGATTEIVWTDGGYVNEQVRGVPLAEITRQPDLLSTTIAEQSVPAVASIDGIHLLAWTESYATGIDTIVLGRIDDAGRALDGYGIRLDSPGSTQDVREVLVIDDLFVVTWCEWPVGHPEQNAIFAQRVTLNGTLHGDRWKVADGDPLLLASNGITLLFARVGWQALERSYGVSIWRSLADGGAVRAATIVMPSWNPMVYSSSATGNGGYLLLFSDDPTAGCQITCPDIPNSGYAVALTGTGELLGPPLLLSSAHARSLWGAWDGTDYLVGWSDDSGLIAQHVTQLGAIASPKIVLAAAGVQLHSIVRDASGFTLAGNRPVPLVVTVNNDRLSTSMVAPETWRRMFNSGNHVVAGARGDVRHVFLSDFDPATLGSPRIYSDTLPEPTVDLSIDTLGPRPAITRLDSKLHFAIRNSGPFPATSVVVTAFDHGECSVLNPCTLGVHEERVLDLEIGSVWGSEQRASSVFSRERDANAADNSVRVTVVNPPCGDANSDGSISAGDVVNLVNGLFAGGPLSPWADATGDGQVTVQDVFALINYLFARGPYLTCQ